MALPQATKKRHFNVKPGKNTNTYASGTVKMATKLYGKNLSTYDDADIDALLAKLTPEELDELNNEVDPDNALLPPSQRCRDQTSKDPTGPLNREKLIRYLEEKAKEEKDWDEKEPHKPGTKRGRVFVPKEIPKNDADGEDEPIELDVDEELALSEATDQDLADLAAYLGMHSILSQTQYWNAIRLGHQDPEDSSHGGVVRAAIPKLIPDEPPNKTDVEDCIKRLNANDPGLNAVNINNMKEVSKERIQSLISSLANNTHLEKFSMANTAVKDEDVSGLIEALEKNKTLTSLNIESNFVSGEMLAKLIRATLKNQSLVEFHAANQRAAVLGNQVEMSIVDAIEENDTLLRVGIAFESMGARHRVSEALERNYERLRLRRNGEDV